MTVSTLTQYADVSELAEMTTAGGAGLLSSWLDFLPESAFLRPGEPLHFAWRVVATPRTRWVSASMELVVEVGGDVEHVWDRRSLSWPPSLVTAEQTDGIWPPIGFVSEDVSPIGGGRQALYHSLGTKTLRLIVTVHDAAGADHVLSADAEIEIGLPAGSPTIVVVSPRTAAWNDPYTVQATASSGAYAALSATLSLTASDGSAFPPSTLRLEAHDAVSQNLAGPIVQNWTWVSKPTYHVLDDQLSRRVVYTPVLTDIRDEFDNVYPPNPQSPASVLVSVSSDKISAAHMSEDNWWTATGLAAGAAISGALASVPVLTIFLAPLAAGAAVEALYFAGVAAMYAQVADDPPVPDEQYFAEVPIPAVVALPQQDSMPALSAVAGSLHRMARCQLAGSAAAGKVLGARLAGSDTAEAWHRNRLAELAHTASSELKTVVANIHDAMAEVSGDDALTPKAISSALAKLSQDGVPQSLRAALATQLGKDFGTAFADLLGDPAMAKSMPALPDVLSVLPVTAHQAMSTGFLGLDAAL
ncbi:hypothetical protein ACPPVT_02325 [Angustibacter sp. McL0619]|uniref:hypothetical protein n=1 Tax=Angustibacter sp. McL0619 TaxID=3415676 RepID=UPI003CE77839